MERTSKHKRKSSRKLFSPSLQSFSNKVEAHLQVQSLVKKKKTSTKTNCRFRPQSICLVISCFSATASGQAARPFCYTSKDQLCFGVLFVELKKCHNPYVCYAIILCMIIDKIATE